MPRVGRKDNHAKSSTARVSPWAVGRISAGRSARGSRAIGSVALITLLQSRSRRPVAVSAKKSLGQRRGVERAPRWHRRQQCQVRQRARTPWAVGRLLTGRGARGRAPRDSETSITTFRSRSRRNVAVVVMKSLVQWRGMERAPIWMRRQPCQVRQRARAQCAVGRPSSRRSPRGPHATACTNFCCVVPRPQPPTWSGVVEEGPRPTAWGGALPALAAKTTTPSPPARACSVGGRPVLHEAKRARAARHGN